jgi:hypothetical protein
MCKPRRVASSGETHEPGPSRQATTKKRPTVTLWSSVSGLVEARREGTKHLYSVRPEGFAPVAAFVEAFWAPKLAALKDDIEKKR